MLGFLRLPQSPSTKVSPLLLVLCALLLLPSFVSTLSLFNDSTPMKYGAMMSGRPSFGVELGIAFSSTVSGAVTAVRVYIGASPSENYTGSLYESDGQFQLLGRGSAMCGDAVSRWHTITLKAPVQLTVNRTYIASYFTRRGSYSYSAIGNVSWDNGVLHAMPRFGRWIHTNVTAFPFNAHDIETYWADVEFNLEVGSTAQPTTTAAEVASTAQPSTTTTSTVISSKMMTTTTSQPMSTSSLSTTPLTSPGQIQPSASNGTATERMATVAIAPQPSDDRALIGGIVGAVLFVLLILIVVFAVCAVKRARNRSVSTDLTGVTPAPSQSTGIYDVIPPSNSNYSERPFQAAQGTSAYAQLTSAEAAPK
jgi:hypothetical protein